MTDALRDALQARRHDDGGFGPYPGVPSTTESTAWAALGLASSDAGASAAALAWLLDRQLPSGAWPHSDEVTEPSWMTSAALLALGHEPSATDAVRRAATWLLRQRGRASPLLTRLFYRFWPERVQVRLDIDLRAWPWTDHAFSWCEPTSMAMLALDRLDRRLVPRYDRVPAQGGRASSAGPGLRRRRMELRQQLGARRGVVALSRYDGPGTACSAAPPGASDGNGEPRRPGTHARRTRLVARALTRHPVPGGVRHGCDGRYRGRLGALWSEDPVETTTRAVALALLALEGAENPFLPGDAHG